MVREVFSVIIPAELGDTFKHVYSEIYGGTGGCTINVNNLTINVGETSNIPLLVRNVSGGTGCYLLGDNRDYYSDYLGNYTPIVNPSSNSYIDDNYIDDYFE